MFFWRKGVSAAQVAATTPAPAFQRIFIIALENDAIGTTLADPYFANLASRGTLLTNYSAITHPSQPNYVALIAGSTIVTDDIPINLPQTNLVDLLSAKNISWKTYHEDYPGKCSVVSSAGGGLYVRRHNAFISMNTIRNSKTRCARIVNASQLDLDIAANALPQYSFFVPNLNNDGHDTSVAYSAVWMQAFLEPKLLDPNFINGTLVVITYDEAYGGSGNKVYTLLLGPMIPRGVDNASYTHYSLLRLVENNFALGTLKRSDASARVIAMPRTPTPTASATPPPTLTASATPPPTDTPVPTDTPMPTDTVVAPTETPVASDTPSPAPIGTATQIGTPAPTATVLATAAWPVRARMYLPVLLD